MKAKPKMMMTFSEIAKLMAKTDAAVDALFAADSAPIGSAAERKIASRLLACADALRKAAGVR